MSNAHDTDHRPIVVCVHGSASNGGQWRSLRQALRGRCRVFTPDLVGYGSRRYRPNGRFRLQNEVDAIIEQIGDIKEPFHLIGHSYGGAVATYFAKQYPERIRSLVLYEPANFAVLFDEDCIQKHRKRSGRFAQCSATAWELLCHAGARRDISLPTGPVQRPGENSGFRNVAG